MFGNNCFIKINSMKFCLKHYSKKRHSTVYLCYREKCHNIFYMMIRQIVILKTGVSDFGHLIEENVFKSKTCIFISRTMLNRSDESGHS